MTALLVDAGLVGHRVVVQWGGCHVTLGTLIAIDESGLHLTRGKHRLETPPIPHRTLKAVTHMLKDCARCQKEEADERYARSRT